MSNTSIITQIFEFLGELFNSLSKGTLFFGSVWDFIRYAFDIALVTFLFLETDTKIKFPETFLALIPCVVYGAVYLFETVIIGEENGGWSDFYTFNKGGFWYITMFALLGVSYLIAVVSRIIHNKMLKVSSEKRSETDD